MGNHYLTPHVSLNEKSIVCDIDKLSDLYHFYGEAFIMIDKMKRISMLNNDTEKIFGYDRSEIIGQPLEIISSHAFHKKFIEIMQLFSLSRADFNLSRLNLEFIGLKKDGSEFPALISLFKNEGEGSNESFVAIREVSDNNPLDIKLRKFRRVVEQTSAIVVITNIKGDIEYVNPSFQKLTGFGIEEVIGRNPRILKSGHVEPNTYQNMWKTITSGNVWRGELCNRKKNGEIYWDFGTVSPIKNSLGKITNYISVKDDITEIKTKEMELLGNKERLEQIVQSKTSELRKEIAKHIKTMETLKENVFRLDQAQQIGRIGSWDLDVQTRKVTWSDETYRIFGLSEQEFDLSYESAMAMVHDEDRDFVHLTLEETMSLGQNIHIDHRIIISNGEVKKVTLQAILIKDSNGNPLKLVGTIQDITERSQMELAMMEKERMKKELLIAHDIQKSMLPVKNPIRKGWQFSSFYQAADDVGGDFYHFFNRSSGKVSIIMADVSGKGLPAALFMAQSLSALKAIASRVRTPANILNQANSLLYKEFNGGDFVTACNALIDPKTGLLRFSNAGHNHPLRYSSATNTIEEIIVESTALGVIPKIKPGEVSIQLGKEDILVFYTDGLTEAFNCANEVFGKTRLEEVIQVNSKNSAERIVNEIVDSWNNFMGSHVQSDDLAIIVVKSLK